MASSVMGRCTTCEAIGAGWSRRPMHMVWAQCDASREDGVAPGSGTLQARPLYRARIGAAPGRRQVGGRQCAADRGRYLDVGLGLGLRLRLDLGARGLAAWRRCILVLAAARGCEVDGHADTELGLLHKRRPQL